ncbi:hypothetical protein K458DRAFT_395644 [Lentithecium fluviatile CBS 122367]|uniref:Uncharacterized protein n=1 Tax=Lentithecium fluviatile CBS 122367 TaxID=1168545 RepID=A0A6G1IHL7_9PLEO|nr:hypothetical protein K458DRAFT_395644 [Lentithecium fluviatile CBS 122367]
MARCVCPYGRPKSRVANRGELPSSHTHQERNGALGFTFIHSSNYCLIFYEDDLYLDINDDISDVALDTPSSGGFKSPLDTMTPFSIRPRRELCGAPCKDCRFVLPLSSKRPFLPFRNVAWPASPLNNLSTVSGTEYSGRPAAASDSSAQVHAIAASNPIQTNSRGTPSNPYTTDGFGELDDSAASNDTFHEDSAYEDTKPAVNTTSVTTYFTESPIFPYDWPPSLSFSPRFPFLSPASMPSSPNHNLPSDGRHGPNSPHHRSMSPTDTLLSGLMWNEFNGMLRQVENPFNDGHHATSPHYGPMSPNDYPASVHDDSCHPTAHHCRHMFPTNIITSYGHTRGNPDGVSGWLDNVSPNNITLPSGLPTLDNPWERYSFGSPDPERRWHIPDNGNSMPPPGATPQHNPLRTPIVRRRARNNSDDETLTRIKRAKSTPCYHGIFAKVEKFLSEEKNVANEAPNAIIARDEAWANYEERQGFAQRELSLSSPPDTATLSKMISDLSKSNAAGEQLREAILNPDVHQYFAEDADFHKSLSVQLLQHRKLIAGLRTWEAKLKTSHDAYIDAKDRFVAATNA